MSRVIPPAGVSPASAFEATEAPKRPKPAGFLADPIDFEDGELLSLEHGIDPTDAWVITQLRTVRASGSAVDSVGRDFSDVTHTTERHANILRQEVLIALAPAIDSKAISNVTVTPETDESSLEILARVHWHNNFTGKQGSEALPLNQLIARN